MIIFKEASCIKNELTTKLKAGKKIGFVPTMGALHDGHLSLLRRSMAENDITVCSIFVNPTQFNNIEDFNLYPITIEKDVELLTTAGVDILFLPTVDEVYPPGYQKKHYNLGRIENILEGFYRPGHFQGVCQVVDRLLEIIAPGSIYMGQKDYQQCIVIRRLLQLTGRTDVQLHICPTRREPDGLAMSSRNLRLDETGRILATHISKILYFIKKELPHHSITELKTQARKDLEKEGFFVDYVEICNADTLEPAKDKTPPLVGLIAASLDDVRLIDNMAL